VVALLAACAAPMESAPPARGGSEAVTYAGEIPCADCPGRRITLTLFPDFTYRLRQTYLGVENGRDRRVHDLGRWARAQDDGRRLMLRGGTEAPRQLLLVRPDTLRMLGADGREIVSAHNYDLVRRAGVDRIEDPIRLRGMYTYHADAATFNECLTGKRYPVLLEGDHASLERAYLAARRNPGEFTTAIVAARFVERAPEPGAPPREHVRVEKFERLLPGETCAPQAPGTAELTETYWRPVEVDGAPVVIHAGTREPHIVLRRDGSRVSGFSGCNTLAGGYKHDGSRLTFGPLITTRMACAGEEGNALEAAFVKALQGTATYRIVREALELRDAAGMVRLRFEALYLR
jgi:copper homeostasis protein (lipoprotein)